MPHQPTREHRKSLKPNDQEKVFSFVWQALADLQFGTVTIVVQDGRVVQIERHEKLRMISNDPA
jgi:hypothetical protein